MKKNVSISNAVIVLNQDFSVVNIVSWRRALRLILKGKAEIVEESEKIIKNFEGTFSFVVPKIIKLVEYVKNVFKAKVSYSKLNVMIRDNFRCLYCDSDENLTIDHVIPLAKGGKTTWENSATACKTCNSLKRDRLLKDTNLHLKHKPHAPNHVEFLKNKIKLFGPDSLLKKDK